MMSKTIVGGKVIPKVGSVTVGSNKTDASVSLSGVGSDDFAINFRIPIDTDAITKAEEAVTTANNANTKSDDAVTTANNANTKADNAATTAINANTKVDNFITNQNNAYMRPIGPNTKMIVIGDSWLDGYTPSGNTTSWGKALKNKLDIVDSNFFSYSLGGIGFSASVNNTTFDTFITKAYNEHKDADIVVLVGGINDIRGNKNAGSSAVSAFNKMINHFPTARCFYFLNWGREPFNGIFANSADHIADAIKSCKGIASDFGSWQWLYDLPLSLSSDRVHPNKDGYDFFATNIASVIKGGSPTNASQEHTVYTVRPNERFIISRNGRIVSLAIVRAVLTDTFEFPSIYGPNVAVDGNFHFSCMGIFNGLWTPVVGIIEQNGATCTLKFNPSTGYAPVDKPAISAISGTCTYSIDATV